MTLYVAIPPELVATPITAVLLASRAEIVDLVALTGLAEAGKFRAAVDVLPEEPFPPDYPIRRVQKLLLSPRRADGTWRWAILTNKQAADRSRLSERYMLSGMGVCRTVLARGST